MGIAAHPGAGVSSQAEHIGDKCGVTVVRRFFAAPGVYNASLLVSA